MRNSTLAIDKREYYLKDAKNKCFVKALYSEGMTKNKLEYNGESISFAEVNQLTRDREILAAFNNILTDPLEVWCFKHASGDMKQSLLYSFYLRVVKKHYKIPNVETSNWLRHRDFSREYARVKSTRRDFKISKPRTLANAFIRLQGKHLDNLRMGHIHLTKDILKGRTVYGIHWDASAVELNLAKLITHWLHDDMPA